ncbi:extracellular solute-binding protein [candidate division KSB3 bacterium]|uniref:Extracellular solute-binding protein n=1 Tax=candidate division KSB3 bacterium TaxID=2044937 RepID=A0A9D5JUB6_9BACT|nr:extracellular solute-binding protein [candidate division KSB3 bacterium]MBD3324392.1 extracellular solute-binding protein [candidate division KSB3 bacterium]
MMKQKTWKVLGSVCMVALLIGTVATASYSADPITLEIVGHRVHKLIATKGDGGDIVTPWVEQNPMVEAVTWNTLEIGPIHDRLFREASLPSTEVGVAYLLNTHALPRVANLLEPLNEWLEKKPIDEFEANFGGGMLDALTFNDKLYGIPVRVAPAGLMWNETIFNERGLDRPPRNPEEFYEFAKKCTYKREDGTQVYGFLILSHYYYTSLVSMARMWDGDLITTDLEVRCNEEPMVKALEMMVKMYEEGIIPKNAPAIKHAEHQRLAQQCVIAMSFDAFGKIHSWNDPEQAVCPTLRVAAPPVADELRDKYPHGGPVRAEFWSMVIPKNSNHKEQAWEFIRYLSSPEAAFRMALNGNGPTRADVFKNPTYAEQVPYSDVALKTINTTRVPIPAFDKTPQAMELIDSYIERALLGDMEPRAAMDELAEELRALSSMLK